MQSDCSRSPIKQGKRSASRKEVVKELIDMPRAVMRLVVTTSRSTKIHGRFNVEIDIETASAPRKTEE